MPTTILNQHRPIMNHKRFIPIAITIAASLSASASLVRAELIAYWTFDEGKGTTAIDTIGGFDGTVTGGAWVAPGRVGPYAFQGSNNDEINCGPGPSPATADLTLAWWMIDNHESYGTIMDKSVTNSGFGYNILVRPRNEDSPLRFRIGGWQSYGGWGEECRLPADAYNDGEWVHIVCTYDSATDTASIYVNGELPLNAAFNPKTGIAGPGGYCDGVNNVETPLYLRGGEETFNGLLDEIAIWDQALTPEEVMAVFTDGPLGLEDIRPFAVTDIDYSSGEEMVTLTWNSKPNRTYNLYESPDLVSWIEIEDGIDSAGEETVHLVPLPAASMPARKYYFVSDGVVTFSP